MPLRHDSKNGRLYLQEVTGFYANALQTLPLPGVNRIFSVHRTQAG